MQQNATLLGFVSHSIAHTLIDNNQMTISLKISPLSYETLGGQVHFSESVCSGGSFKFIQANASLHRGF